MFDGFLDDADVPQTTQAYAPEWTEQIADVFRAFALRISCTAQLTKAQSLGCWVRDDATQITFTPAAVEDPCISLQWGTRVGIVEWSGPAGR